MFYKVTLYSRKWDETSLVSGPVICFIVKVRQVNTDVQDVATLAATFPKIAWRPCRHVKTSYTNHYPHQTSHGYCCFGARNRLSCLIRSAIVIVSYESVDGWGVMLQAGRSWVQVSMRWLHFFNVRVLNPYSSHGLGVYSTSNRNEYQKIFLGVKRDRCPQKYWRGMRNAFKVPPPKKGKF
jgi:hypothetical protein